MMELLKLSASERVVMVRNRVLANDESGQEILIGLDRRQSEWLVASLNQDIAALSDTDRQRFLKLYEQHERVRFGAARPGAHDI